MGGYFRSDRSKKFYEKIRITSKFLYVETRKIEVSIRTLYLSLSFFIHFTSNCNLFRTKSIGNVDVVSCSVQLPPMHDKGRMQVYKNQILAKLDFIPNSITPVFKDSCTASAQAVLFCLTGQARTVPDMLRDADTIGNYLTPEFVSRLIHQRSDSVLLFDIGDHKFCVLCVFEEETSFMTFELLQSNQDAFSINLRTGSKGTTFTLKEWLLRDNRILKVPYLGRQMDGLAFSAFCEKLNAADEPDKFDDLFGVPFRRPAAKGKFTNIPL